MARKQQQAAYVPARKAATAAAPKRLGVGLWSHGATAAPHTTWPEHVLRV